MILFSFSSSCLRREQNIKSKDAPTDTCKQTKQRSNKNHKYAELHSEQLDMKWDVFTVEYSSDHSWWGVYEKSNKTWADVLLQRPPAISKSKQRDTHKALGALQEYLQIFHRNVTRHSTCAIKDLNKQ